MFSHLSLFIWTKVSINELLSKLSSSSSKQKKLCHLRRTSLTEESITHYTPSCTIRERSGDGTQITHLLFVDDTLVFCEASQEQMAY